MQSHRALRARNQAKTLTPRGAALRSPPTVPSLDDVAPPAVHELKTGYFDFQGPDLLALIYVMPTDHKIAITAHARLARCMKAIWPALDVWVLEDRGEFCKEADRLSRTAIDINRLHESGSSVEETLRACEEIAFRN